MQKVPSVSQAWWRSSAAGEGGGEGGGVGRAEGEEGGGGGERGRAGGETVLDSVLALAVCLPCS